MTPYTAGKMVERDLAREAAAKASVRRPALVVLSGGQDSTTCLYWALAQNFTEIHAITFDYGQRSHISSLG